MPYIILPLHFIRGNFSLILETIMIINYNHYCKCKICYVALVQREKTNSALTSFKLTLILSKQSVSCRTICIVNIILLWSF